MENKNMLFHTQKIVSAEKVTYRCNKTPNHRPPMPGYSPNQLLTAGKNCVARQGLQTLYTSAR